MASRPPTLVKTNIKTPIALVIAIMFLGVFFVIGNFLVLVMKPVEVSIISVSGILAQSGEQFAFGSYKGPFGMSICGDNPNENLITASDGAKRCCRFAPSIIENGICVQNDGRINNKKLTFKLVYDEVNNVVNCTQPAVVAFDPNKYQMKDSANQPATGYTIFIRTMSGNTLKSYKIQFDQTAPEIYWSNACFTVINGERVFNADLCHYDIEETINLPCYSNAARIIVRDNASQEICKLPIGGLCQ